MFSQPTLFFTPGATQTWAEILRHLYLQTENEMLFSSSMDTHPAINLPSPSYIAASPHVSLSPTHLSLSCNKVLLVLRSSIAHFLHQLCQSRIVRGCSLETHDLHHLLCLRSSYGRESSAGRTIDFRSQFLVVGADRDALLLDAEDVLLLLFEAGCSTLELERLNTA